MLTGNLEVECQRSTTGGKGNRGRYVERDKRVCAAGIPTAQADFTFKSTLDQYLLKDEVDALISDAIIPPPPRRPLLFMCHPPERDERTNPVGLVADLINPPNKTKFQSLVDDLKDTAYESYWKKPLGQVPDATPMFPKGFDIENTRYGKKTAYHGRLYDIVMPKDPLPDKTPLSKRAGAQMCRNYCKPAFNPDLTYGHRSFADPRGILVKCNLTDDKVLDGTSNRTNINYIQADLQQRNKPLLGKVLAPNNNISCVAEGHSFGKLQAPVNIAECLSTCKQNKKLAFFRKCLAHLNTLRKIMSTLFLPTFFNKFYLSLKYYDKEKTGWLPKEIIYNACASKLIRFDPALIEPLLCMWEAFDGSKIEYNTFVLILNFKQCLPDLPKVPDIHPDCLDFRTTYREMVKPGQAPDERLRAGVPSGRYLDLDYPITPDGCCRAHRSCLPQESDMKSCLNPSILTLLHVNHRQMYAKRDPATVRKVFEAAGEQFTDETFSEIWEEAKKYHSLGWVCFETFRKALNKNKKS